LRLYARYVEATLAYTVLCEIESEELPCPPSFDGLFPVVPAAYPVKPSPQ
jgi:hypothetical protein